jgi:methylmalonyl-CoA/ethylmalonyl-CoA epimerase
MSPTPNEPLLRRLAQVAIVVHEPERATAWYRDTLGLRHLFSAGNLSFFDIAGTRLMLSPPEGPEFDRPASILYFDVADIAEAHDRLTAAGVRFVEEPHVVAPLATTDLWMASFRDSEGNLLALQSEVARRT